MFIIQNCREFWELLSCFLHFDFVIFALKQWHAGWCRLQNTSDPTVESRTQFSHQLDMMTTCCRRCLLSSDITSLMMWLSTDVFLMSRICCVFVKVHLVRQFWFCVVPTWLFVSPAHWFPPHCGREWGVPGEHQGSTRGVQGVAGIISSLQIISSAQTCGAQNDGEENNHRWRWNLTTCQHYLLI